MQKKETSIKLRKKPKSKTESIKGEINKNNPRTRQKPRAKIKNEKIFSALTQRKTKNNSYDTGDTQIKIQNGGNENLKMSRK